MLVTEKINTDADKLMILLMTLLVNVALLSLYHIVGIVVGMIVCLLMMVVSVIVYIFTWGTKALCDNVL